MKAICMEFTVVGREKGLHSEEKEEGEEEACREKEGLLNADAMNANN